MQDPLETAAALAQEQYAAARRQATRRPLELALLMRDFEREVRASYPGKKTVMSTSTQAPPRTRL